MRCVSYLWQHTYESRIRYVHWTHKSRFRHIAYEATCIIKILICGTYTGLFATGLLCAPPPLDFQTLRRPCHMIVEHNHYGLRKDFDEDTAIHALSADAARMAIARTPIK